MVLCSSFYGIGQTNIFEQSYPRIGAFHWGGGRAELYAKYDLIMGGAPPEAKQLNPNLKILPTFGWQAYGYNETQLGPGFDHKNWYMKNSKGGDLWAGWGGYYVDFTDYCPPSQNSSTAGLKFNQYLPDYILQKIDLNVYDGIATDWLQSFPWGISDSQNPLPGDIDIDRNGINDFVEHGEGWVRAEWLKWIDNLISKIRNRLNTAGFSAKPMLINSGGFHDFCWSNTNGVVIEYGSDVRSLGLNGFKSKYDQWMLIAPQPHVMLINTTLPNKNAFSEMRYFLGVALLGDGYFDPEDELSRDHYIKQYYDEMDLNLGFPTGPAHKLSSSADESIWVRFFDYGAVIVNGIPSPQMVSDSELKQVSGYNGPFWRFRGSQDADFNNGEPFTNITLNGLQQSNEKIGDAIILLKSPQAVIADIIIDNDHLMTSPSQNSASLSGTWSNQQGDVAWSWGRYDWLGHVAYLTSDQAGSQAKFQAKITVPGQYEIFEWHPVRLDASENVRFEIFSVNGAITKVVNQRINGGKWNSLGIYSLAKGEDTRVIMSGSGLVIADAIKLVYKESRQVDSILPNEPRELKSENRTENSIVLSWLPPLPAADGDVASSYQVYRDNSLVGTPTSASYVDYELSENTTYSYTVYAIDDAGNRSNSAAINSFTTATDMNPPSIVSVRALSLTLVEIIFSEAVEKTSAEDKNNYSIDNNIIILSTSIKDNLKTVHLATSEHIVGTKYTITVNNIKDRAQYSNIII
ncbi:MAG: hypothetical protein JW866_03735, partial [Ignavibacteriales bacterium]|nr:hypothetical protein [Ignavibacteriales bacterium]